MISRYASLPYRPVATFLKFFIPEDFYRISQKAMDEMGRLLEGGAGRRMVLDHQIIRMQYQDVIS